MANVLSLSGWIVWEYCVCPISTTMMCALTEPRHSVIKSIFGEITDSTNEAQAMPLINIMWNVGAIVGPILGGTLSAPAQQYPNSFLSRVRLFQNYPYVYCILQCYLNSVLSHFQIPLALPCGSNNYPCGSNLRVLLLRGDERV